MDKESEDKSEKGKKVKGKIYLIPNTLGGETLENIIPFGVSEFVKTIRNFAVEDLKSARRLLRKIDREFPIDDSHFFVLNKKTPPEDLFQMLKPLSKGEDLGIISDAGMPGIADPGASLIALAHQRKIPVAPFVGPSSILLALIASGFNGQEFSFNGYLPKEHKKRIHKLKELEQITRRTGQTQIFMDTPFRNMHVLDDLLNHLSDDTMICIASNLTLPQENIQTMSVRDWRENAYDLDKIPALFLIGRQA